MKRKIDTMLWYLDRTTDKGAAQASATAMIALRKAHKRLHPKTRLPGIQHSEENLNPQIVGLVILR